MTDSQLLVLVIAIVFPLSVFIFQLGMAVSAINRLSDTLKSIQSDLKPADSQKGTLSWLR